METELQNIINVDTSEMYRIFTRQKENQFNDELVEPSSRKARLKKFLKVFLKNRIKIQEALYQDYKKHPFEVDMTEFYPVSSEIKFALKNLRRWTGRHRVSTPPAYLGSSSWIKYEPKGVVLIISPWNFPINLTFSPLVSAVAAGNTVIIKPSEHTPHASALMKEIITETFSEDQVALIEGGVETSTHLLSLPFNHIFFTGAPKIGKIVMEAAAKNLTSVTLELGGKSPTIVDDSADIKLAAQRIAWTKFINLGQVCLAPDYIYVHSKVKNEFTKAIKSKLAAFYSENAINEPSYARLVNQRHFDRVKNYIDDAIKKGAQIVSGAKYEADKNYIAPTLLSNVSVDSAIMNNEIFGPALPLFEYDDILEIIKEINNREKPLALYIYSKNKKNINYILKNTRAGGTCINHSAIHFNNHNLPFGGSNNSGIGKSHGWWGFQEFSNARAILKQNVPNALDLLVPPYNAFKQKIINFTIKYL